MKRFAALLEQLVYTSSRNEKLRHLHAYFADVPDPDRGIAVAAIAGTLDIPNVTAKTIRTLAERRVDPTLFALSYDFVGDLAETTSLIWPSSNDEDLALSAVAETLQTTPRNQIGRTLEDLMDRLDQSSRFALLKLATGGLRVGVSARLLKVALADYGDQPVEEIEELWFGLAPPYTDLFAWLEGRAGRPAVEQALLFRPAMLAHPLEDADLEKMSPNEFAAEWKWDGIRVQAAISGGEQRLYTRTGENIGQSFPDLLADLGRPGVRDGVIDGELLVYRDGAVQPFDQLQKRLGRKSPIEKFMQEFPAHIFAYDLLDSDGQDQRALSFDARRRNLDAWISSTAATRLHLSPLIETTDWQTLGDLRSECRDNGMEGLMLKRRVSPYLAGRVKGHWYKWKRDPLSADCVLMYAQRGHGKRSSFYSDYTFGCWTETDEGATLVPVGKAYSGYTDDELLKIDKFIRDNTVDRFGPVRAVKPDLVFEVAFDAVQRSTRHKSGIAMRFPRIKRIRWDKPAADADPVSALSNMLDEAAPL